MFLLMVGAVIGANWGAGFSVLGVVIGWLLSSQPDLSSGNYLVPALTAEDDIDDNLLNSTLFNDSSSEQDSYISGSDGLVINPASGLPMIDGVGCVDVGGNVYGCDDHGIDACSISGVDDLSNSLFDDTCGIDDSFDSFSSSGFDDSFDSFSDSGFDDSFI